MSPYVGPTGESSGALREEGAHSGMHRIVVIGGSGFVGRYVVGRLAADGHQVVVPTRRRETAKHLILLPTVDVVETRIHDPVALAALFTGATVVINLVGILNEGNGATFARAHTELARNVVTACKTAGVTRLLQMSALNADPAGPSLYLQTKGEAEALVMASGLRWTIFRPSVIFGPGDSFLSLFALLLRRLPVIALAAPQARFAPIFIGDVAHCIVAAIDDELAVGARFNLCGPKVYTLREIVRYVGEVTGAVRPIIPLGSTLSSLQAFVLEHAPGTLMSRDNLKSMSIDNVCNAPFPALFGIVPASLESVAPGYLAPAARRSAFDAYRAHGGR
ncbi:MAG: complex I NDUFA9 subunit family protein [Casimicrobiaceae bacterium]